MRRWNTTTLIVFYLLDEVEADRKIHVLSPHQNAIFADITTALSARRTTLEEHHSSPQNTTTWEKFRVLLGKPGTGKSQVLIRAIDHTIHTDKSVLVAAPVVLLAQGYNSIFLDDIDSDTLHGALTSPSKDLIPTTSTTLSTNMILLLWMRPQWSPPPSLRPWQPPSITSTPGW